MTLTQAGHHHFSEAAQELYVTLTYAEMAFSFLARLHSDQDYIGHLGFEAVVTLCGQGCKGSLDQHGKTVESLIKWHNNQEVM